MNWHKTAVPFFIGLSILAPRAAQATITDTGYANTLPASGAHDGWDYVDRAAGAPSGACTSGPSGASSRGTASYDPGNNATYWFPAWDFDPLPARAGMHIIAVAVDVHGSNGQTTGGNINVDMGVTGTNITTTVTNRIWDGSTVDCDWFSAKSGQAPWNVTPLINSLDINTIRAMRVRVKRHTDAGTPGSNTYYDIFVKAFRVQVTWMFDPPLSPTNVRKTAVCPNSTTLGWSNNPGNQPGRVCGYEIWRSMDGAQFQVVVPGPNNCTNISLPEGSTSFVDGSTLPGHTYVYQIRAFGEGGVSGLVSTPVGSINWINPAGGDWNTTTNWDQNRLPVQCDFVTISQAGSYTVTLPAQTTQIQGILVGGAPGLQRLSVSGGTFRVSASEAITAAPGTGQIQFAGTALDTYNGAPNRMSGDQNFWNGEALRGIINDGTLRVAGIGTVTGDLVNQPGATVIVTGGDCCSGTTMLNVTGLYQNNGNTVLNGSAGNYAAIIDARNFVNNGTMTFGTGASGTREIRTKSGAESPAAFGFRNYGSIVANVPARITRFLETWGGISTSAPLTLANDASGIPSIANSGNVSIQAAGSIVVSGSNLSNNQQGTLSGPGTLSFLPVDGGPGLVNSGTLWACAGGSGIGKLSYSGSFTQTSTGRLHVNLGGINPGTGYDQIELTGMANLGGTLDVHFVNGFVPPSASGFYILSSNGTIGAFQTVNIPNVAPDTLKVRYTDPGVALVSVNGVVGVDPVVEPARFHMDPPFPSPARGSMTLRFGLEKEAVARVEILDARGRSLRTLVHGVYAAGTRTVIWDGRDDRGTAMASGKYFVRLSAHDRQISRPALLLR